MASIGAATAIEARLAAGFDRCPIYGNNATGETPTDGSPYLVVQYVGGEDIASLGDTGNRLFREEGGARFVLHLERSRGVAQGRQWVEELRALFRGVEFSGVITYAPSLPAEGDDNEEGNYYLLSFAVPYEYDQNF